MTTVLDCFLHWNVKPGSLNAMALAGGVLTHEFGDQRKVSKATETIAKCAIKISLIIGKPLICQQPGDIVAVLEGVKPLYVVETHLLHLGAYVDTEEVNRQAAREFKKYGIKTVVLVAHPHHIWRAGKNLERRGIEVVYSTYHNIPYDPTCSRWWLRSPWFFIPREIVVRLYYLSRGRI
jgi:hypothetical protein